MISTRSMVYWLSSRGKPHGFMACNLHQMSGLAGSALLLVVPALLAIALPARLASLQDILPRLSGKDEGCLTNLERVL